MAENLDIYESCRQLRKTNRPDVLDDLLEIEFIHVPTKKLLKRARFFVTADEPTSQWIRKHPTFSRGCWPLGLMNLHQWFWKLKFIEVDRHLEIEGGSFDPKVGKSIGVRIAGLKSGVEAVEVEQGLRERGRAMPVDSSSQRISLNVACVKRCRSV